MTVKVNAKFLGFKEPVEIKESNRNFQKTLLIQKKMLKVEAMPDDASDMDMLDAAIETNDAISEFITDLLGLKAKQKTALEDASTQETGNLVRDIIAAVQHQDVEEITAEQAKDAAADDDLSETEKK